MAYWIDYGMIYLLVKLPGTFQLLSKPCSRSLPRHGSLLARITTSALDKGRIEEADEISGLLKDLPLDHQDFLNEKRVILDAVKFEHSQPKMTVRQLLFEKSELKLLRRVVIGFSCQCIQQLTGIPVVIGYLPYVAHSQIGLNQNLAQIMGGIGAIVCFFASFPPIYFGEFHPVWDEYVHFY